MLRRAISPIPPPHHTTAIPIPCCLGATREKADAPITQPRPQCALPHLAGEMAALLAPSRAHDELLRARANNYTWSVANRFRLPAFPSQGALASATNGTGPDDCCHNRFQRPVWARNRVTTAHRHALYLESRAVHREPCAPRARILSLSGRCITPHGFPGQTHVYGIAGVSFRADL